MTPQDIADRLKAVPEWTSDGTTISRVFRFPDFEATMAFVNGVADIARRANHHPDMEVGYSRVRVSYTTHDAGGLSDKDFASAAQVDQLIPS